MGVLEHAADFMWRNARLLERALFANQLLGAPADQVRDVLRACRNPDGGFGHALEADIRGPSSQPLHTEIALRALQQAGVRDTGLAEGTCAFLASIAHEDGTVPIGLPSMLDYPRAAHWNTLDTSDGPLNPTGALVGLLHWQGVEHPWLERASAWCWQRLEAPITEAHALRCALTFLRFAPDQERARALAPKVAGQAFGASYFNAEPGAASYGLTPLQLVPTPDAPGRSVFSDALINAHLDDLCAQQQDDGGWPITWTAPGPGAAMEWRGMMTLEALTTLRAHGRI